MNTEEIKSIISKALDIDIDERFEEKRIWSKGDKAVNETLYVAILDKYNVFLPIKPMFNNDWSVGQVIEFVKRKAIYRNDRSTDIRQDQINNAGKI